MNRFPFKSYLTSNYNTTSFDVQKLLSDCESITVKKHTYLLRAGQKAKHAFYVKQGLLNQHHIDTKGKTHIFLFAPENWLLADRESEYFNQPSSYFIEALEDSEVYLITQDALLKFSNSNPAFMETNIHMLQKHILSLQKRVTMMQSATAEERYLEFIKTYPDILMRVPQTMVASYLGIAPESLSRIRKDLAHKNKSTS
jgi:CRP-like cAMP-binding protein